MFAFLYRYFLIIMIQDAVILRVITVSFQRGLANQKRSALLKLFQPLYYFFNHIHISFILSSQSEMKCFPKAIYILFRTKSCAANSTLKLSEGENINIVIKISLEIIIPHKVEGICFRQELTLVLLNLLVNLNKILMPICEVNKWYNYYQQFIIPVFISYMTVYYMYL